MRCDHAEREELVEKYLTSRLSAPEQEAFEEHYFSCSRCFDSVEIYRALQAELKEAASAIRAEPLPRVIPWRWAWAAGVATVAAVVTLVVWLRPPARELAPRAPVAVTPAPSSPSLTELARVEPPPYVPATLRGAADQATQRFRAGMQHYVKADFRGALPDLRAAAKLNPKAPEIQFFLGICYLITEQTDRSIAHLRATVALGDTPYLEEAHFYLGKAFLRQKDIGAAQDVLQRTVKLHGKLEHEAQELLRQLEPISRALR